LPIYVSDVYASINRVNFYGSEGVSGFVKRQYDMTFEADISDAVTKDQVKLKHDSGLYSNFESCSSSNTSNTCSIHITKGVNSEIEVCPSATFSVEQYDTNNVLVDSKNVNVKCDYQAPIATATISSASSNGGTLTLNYNLRDPETSATKCSGIGNIEFYIDNIANGPATLAVDSSNCLYTNSYSFSTASYSDGNHKIIIKAYDRMGNSNTANVSFIVDKSAPAFSASARVKDSNGNTLLYFKPQNVLVDVTLEITDITGINSYNIDHSALTAIAPTCNKIGTSVICTWNNLQMYMNNATFSKTINVQARDMLGNNVSMPVNVIGSITSDSVAPTVSINDLNVRTVDGSVMEWFRPGPMRLSFYADIYDELSGIKSVSGDFSSLQTISGDIPSCSNTAGTYRCTWSNLIFNANSANFNKQFRIIAVDDAGNQKIESKTVSFSYKADNSVPALSNFIIKKANGQNITGWIGNVVIPAKVYVDVAEKGSGIEKVSADFSSLNPAYTNYLTGTCTQTSGLQQNAAQAQTNGIYQTFTGNASSNVSLPEYKYRCVWDINIHFNSSGNPYDAQIIFNATDKSLNSANPTFNQAFQVDVDGPIVTSLITTRFYNGLYYVGVDPNGFSAAITDSGIGLNNSEAYLDLTELGFENNKKADSCSNGMCHWSTLGCESIGEGVHKISVNTNTKDNLGNHISQAFYANVTLHKERPSVNSINVTPIVSSTELFRDYIQTGNALYIVANVTEQLSLLSATADLSNFISNETDILADDCTRQTDSDNQSDNWVCVWSTDEIDITSYKKGNIYLNFTDVAGNNIVKPYEIEVFEALKEVNDYWGNSAKGNSPNTLDRQLVTFYNPSMWFTMALTSKEGLSAQSRWPIDVIVESCLRGNSSVNGTPSANYLSSANGNKPLITNPNGQTPLALPYNFYLNYELEKSAPSGNSIDITCQLKIKTLVDSKKISPYETENVTVTINYYNNPLGTLNENIKGEIKDVKDGWLVSQEWIGQIEKILKMAEGLCNLIKNIYAIAKIIGGISDGMKSNAYTEAIGVVLGTTAGSLGAAAEGTWQSYVNKFCKFLNCQLFYGKDWGGEDNKGDTAQGDYADYSRWKASYSKFLNPKDSLIYSLIYLCLPGIIYNLQKARVIECQYINCLKSTANGMPLQMCVRQRDYGWCSYIYGQLFNLIPFAGMFNQLMNNVKKMLEQPVEILSVGLKLVCKSTCASPAPGCTACMYVEGISLLLDLLCDLGIGSDQCEPFWKSLDVDDKACEEALKDIDDSSTADSGTESATVNAEA
jgi:hypothetical protein